MTQALTEQVADPAFRSAGSLAAGYGQLGQRRTLDLFKSTEKTAFFQGLPALWSP